MFSVLKLLICIALLSTIVEAAVTTCEESEKLFADLCFAPRPTLDYDIKWSMEAQPSDGWHVGKTNDVAMMHVAEILFGKPITQSDNLEDPCLRSKLVHGDGVTNLLDGNVYGFGQPTAKWGCNASLDYPGVVKCEMNSLVTKYSEKFNMYPIFSDNKNLQVSVLCFPNGQVGWMALSIYPVFTDEEIKVVRDRVTSVGFSEDTIFTTYTEKCFNEL